MVMSLMTFGDPYSPNYPIFVSFVAFLIFVLGERRDLNFGTQVGYIKSYQINKNLPPKGAWLRSRDVF